MNVFSELLEARIAKIYQDEKPTGKTSFSDVEDLEDLEALQKNKSGLLDKFIQVNKRFFWHAVQANKGLLKSIPEGDKQELMEEAFNLTMLIFYEYITGKKSTAVKFEDEDYEDAAISDGGKKLYDALAHYEDKPNEFSKVFVKFITTEIRSKLIDFLRHKGTKYYQNVRDQSKGKKFEVTDLEKSQSHADEAENVGMEEPGLKEYVVEKLRKVTQSLPKASQKVFEFIVDNVLHKQELPDREKITEHFDISAGRMSQVLSDISKMMKQFDVKVDDIIKLRRTLNLATKSLDYTMKIFASYITKEDLKNYKQIHKNSFKKVK